MSTRGGWILRLPAGALRAAAQLRERPGVHIAIAGDTLWLRGDGNDPGEIKDQLLVLDAELRGHADSSGSIIASGASVPTAELPDTLDWQPLSSAPPIALPPAAGGGAEIAPAPLRIVPSASAKPAELLSCPFDQFATWGLSAPEIRLKPLRFAASSNGHALVIGSPLPPLEGTRFTLDEGIACPLGFGWSPPVSANALRKSAGARPGDLIVFHDPTRPPVRLDAELFVPADRAALRATQG